MTGVLDTYIGFVRYCMSPVRIEFELCLAVYRIEFVSNSVMVRITTTFIG